VAPIADDNVGVSSNSDAFWQARAHTRRPPLTPPTARQGRDQSRSRVGVLAGAGFRRTLVVWRRMSPTATLGRTNRLLAVLVFVLIGTASMAVTSFAVTRTRTVERQVQLIVDDALESIRLVARMDHDIDQQRIALDRHLFERQPFDVKNEDATIAGLEADLAAAARAYDPLARFPNERVIWEKARAEIEAVKPPMERAIEFSRESRDAEALQAMAYADTELAALRQDFDQLIAINNKGATGILANISTIRSQLLFTFWGMGAATLIGTVLLGLWLVRLWARSDAQMALTARMLEERNRDLDAFAGRVAHDIRAPLQAISLAATSLTKTAPQESRTLEVLRRAVGRMDAIVDDLLALARIEELRGSCDPALIAAQIGAEFAGLVQSENGTLRVVADHATVRCSNGLIHQTLANLTENAVKYRRPGVPLQIDISGNVSGEAYDLRVCDNGMGMSSDEAGRVFQPFYRAPRTSNLPGTGLGLSIVKRVAEASGGTVSVETRLGQGTTFVVRLPLAEPAHAPKGD
jgi:two-component system, OmpR family, sensor kinase